MKIQFDLAQLTHDGIVQVAGDFPACQLIVQTIPPSGFGDEEQQEHNHQHGRPNVSENTPVLLPIVDVRWSWRRWKFTAQHHHFFEAESMQYFQTFGDFRAHGAADGNDAE